MARPQLQSDRVAFEIEVAVEYELSVNGETAKVVEVDEAVGVGDALLLDDEVWFLLRASEFTALRGRMRSECRRALRVGNQAQQLIDHVKELQLTFTEARELHSK